jgi:hypothetical protein
MFSWRFWSLFSAQELKKQGASQQVELALVEVSVVQETCLEEGFGRMDRPWEMVKY